MQRIETFGVTSMHTPNATDPLAGPPPERAEIVGQRWTLPMIAAALGCTERAVYDLVARLQLPYIRVLGKRFYDPADIRRALERDAQNCAPSGRGRPRRAA